jgi:hypothetical protein
MNAPVVSGNGVVISSQSVIDKPYDRQHMELWRSALSKPRATT